MLICPVAELERMTSESVATRLTLSLTTSRGIQCDRSARYKDKGVLQRLVIDLFTWWCELIEMLIRSWRSEQNIKKVQHVSHACNNSHVLIYPMLCNIVYVFYQDCMTKYIRIIKKQNTCNATLDLSTAVKPQSRSHLFCFSVDY